MPSCGSRYSEGDIAKEVNCRLWRPRKITISGTAHRNRTVFVISRHADDDFELHEIVLGKSVLGKIEVVSGLREGEQVVVDGVFTLKSAVLKGTIAEEEH